MSMNEEYPTEHRMTDNSSYLKSEDILESMAKLRLICEELKFKIKPFFEL